ncbi:hypothetical protein VPNG_04108 [Cytospora leucostoma]|uniref:Uncharacterized protein n=1 Tax=Cytospora leucostoma TaxID=1230097 RepID=A0A423XDG8_9PEZI|nr:hypothetical protein VPNG_04108 [Cytospora leucostoma]
MALTPVVLSPALPSELLTYIIQQETHPTTLIICSSRTEFLAQLVLDMQDTTMGQLQDDNRREVLLSSPLYQVAIARHIRMVFVPTVSHLRAYLSVFTHEDSKVPPPPTHTPAQNKRQQKLLLVYGLLNLHRDTSEWSAQGISSTAATLVEAARKTGFRAVVVDPPRPPRQSEEGRDEAEDRGGNEVPEADGSLLSDEVPVLSASTRRAGADLDDAAWTGRKVALGRVLGRWFRFNRANWA